MITELADDAAAVAVVLHHVLADGLGGVSVDPDHGPDLDDLTRTLQNELDSIIASS